MDSASSGGARRRPSEQELREELAAVYRLIAHFGMSDLVFTHISQRLPGTESRFLINPYGFLFEEITASSLVVVDADGRAVGSDMLVNPAGFVIHSAIHLARKDANCVLHTHTRAGCAVAAQEHGLLPVNQMALEFYQRIGYHEYEGVSLSMVERDRLTASLGCHHALVLRNHGLLTVGDLPRQAFLRMYYLNRACEIQIDALGGGTPLVIPDAMVCERAARQLAGQATGGDDYVDAAAPDLAWAALLRLVGRIAPDYAT